MEREGSSRKKRVRSIGATTSTKGRSSMSLGIGVSYYSQILSSSPIDAILLYISPSSDHRLSQRDTNDSPIYSMRERQDSRPYVGMNIYMLIYINCNFVHVFNKFVCSDTNLCVCL